MNLENVIRNHPVGPFGSARHSTDPGPAMIRQRARPAESLPSTGTPIADSGPRPEGPLAGRHLLLVAGSSREGDGPGVNALAVHIERAAGQVSILPSASIIADLLGRRVVGRPDLIVAVLPGRGASMAAVRVAERLGVPLLALVNSDAAASWGEASTLRLATRVAVTSERLRERVTATGVAPEVVELWDALLPSALAAFEEIVGRTLRTAMSSSGVGRDD
jgi:hypothetical protein